MIRDPILGFGVGWCGKLKGRQDRATKYQIQAYNFIQLGRSLLFVAHKRIHGVQQSSGVAVGI